MSPSNTDKTNAAKEIFNYLAQKDNLIEADIIIGFGHFDKKIPEYCAQLKKKNYAPLLLFTGGIGSGTADLGMSEGDYFNKVAQEFGVNADYVENTSTNTPLNIKQSSKLLERNDHFLEDMETVILIANAYRQRRVNLTFQKMYPETKIISAPPLTTFEIEKKMFYEKSQNLTNLMIGELERIIEYGKKGDLLQDAIPQFIGEAYLTITEENLIEI